MSRTEKHIVTLDRCEHGVVIHALNDLRTRLIQSERPTDVVDEILLKTIDAPVKKVCDHEER